MQELVLDTPLDMHLHLREGRIMQMVTPLSAESFAAAVIMPNLIPPVTTVSRVKDYAREIMSAVGENSFTPLMTVFFKPYTARELEELKPYIFAVKFYPSGVTTNSEGGVESLGEVKPTIAAMEDLEIPLLIHGETSGFTMDREAEFLPFYAALATEFPRLKVVMEHITTAAAVSLLDRYEHLYATITVHHLLLTLDDLAGGLLQPHLFCKQLLKRPEDRAALVEVATSGHPKVMLGTDSAPHPVDAKECAACSAGVFTAPVALPLLAELFERERSLHHLQAFG